MADAESRRAIPFSASELVYQSVPYIYTSGTVLINEPDAEYVFYQTWSDGRVPQKDIDVALPETGTDLAYLVTRTE
jgi:hypothetical protein